MLELQRLKRQQTTSIKTVLKIEDRFRSLLQKNAMDNPILSLFESLFANVKEYFKERIDLIKLKLVDKASTIVSSILSFLVIFVVLIFFLFCLNVGVALYIGSLIGKTYLGFLIVAGFYAIAGLVFVLVGKRLFKSLILGLLIGKIYKKNDIQKTK